MKKNAIDIKRTKQIYVGLHVFKKMLCVPYKQQKGLKTMSTHLANQISIRMRAKKLSVSSLERAAGLSNHSVRNILRGKSKRPSAEVILAVADVLGCSINDLMVKEEIFENTGYSGDKQKILNANYKPSDLMEESVRVVNEKLKRKRKTLTLKQLLNCVEEVYIHAFQNGNNVDEAYADWFIDLLEG